MNVVLITNPIPLAGEIDLLPELLACGVARCHLRWPEAERSEVQAALRRIPSAYRGKMVLHQHHELAPDFGIGELHWKDGSAHPTPAPRGFRTRSCHTEQGLKEAYGRYDSILVAPVFPSISKPGHFPRVAEWNLANLRAAGGAAGVTRSRICALGGVNAARLPACKDAGFDEVAVLGAVWLADDPVSTAMSLCRAAIETSESDCRCMEGTQR